MKPTLKRLSPPVEHNGRRSGVAEHTDGDHTCHMPYREVQEGENLAGQNAVIVSKDGSYEMLTPGTKLACGGPPQVATEAYRNGWEQTFGSRGGVS